MNITYNSLQYPFIHLAAVIDQYNRYVPAWELSNTMESFFCAATLKQALTQGNQRLFNTDQGSQFTSEVLAGVLPDKNIAVSMDGRGRALGNVSIERLWWTVKYEEVYPKAYPE